MTDLKSNQRIGSMNELVQFFLISFIFSWILWAPRVMNSIGWIKIPVVLDIILNILPVFGPGAAAFWITSRSFGKSGVKALWKRGWTLDASKLWLLPAILIMPIIAGLTTLIMTILEIDVPWEYSLPPALIAPIFLSILISAAGEEYGWRGYALDRLQSRWSPLQASLILGFIWGVWHLPLHFIDGSTQQQIPIWQFIVQSMVLSILYTWLVNKTNGSVLMAIIFHSFANLTGALVPTWVDNSGRWITLLLLVATIFGISMYLGIRNYRRKLQE